MPRHTQRRARLGRAAIVVLVAAGALTGCAQQAHFTGHSGTCRYGLGAGASGLGCYRRAKPSNDLVAQAMTPAPLARALAAWRRAHGASLVASVGINWWAETTIAVRRDKDRLVTFDAQGRSTSGDDGYVSSAHDPFPIRAVRPDVFGRLLAAIREGQPSTRLARAVVSVDPFSNAVTWRFAVVSSQLRSDILYRAAADGSGLCHGRDLVNDALVPAAGIPACGDNILPF